MAACILQSISRSIHVLHQTEHAAIGTIDLYWAMKPTFVTQNRFQWIKTGRKLPSILRRSMKIAISRKRIRPYHAHNQSSRADPQAIETTNELFLF